LIHGPVFGDIEARAGTGIDPDVPRETRGHPGVTIDIKTAFHLAKARGAVALDLPIRVFSPGYQFDAIAIDPNCDLPVLGASR